MAMRVSVVAEAILHSLPSTSSHSPPSPHFRLATPSSGPCGHSCVLLSPAAVSGQSRNPYTVPEFSTALQNWGIGVGVKLGWSVVEVGRTVGVKVGWGVGVEVEGGVVGPDMKWGTRHSLIKRHVMINTFNDYVTDKSGVSTHQLLSIDYQSQVNQLHKSPNIVTGTVPHVGAKWSALGNMKGVRHCCSKCGGYCSYYILVRAGRFSKRSGGSSVSLLLSR